VIAFSGGNSGTANRATIFASLKPLQDRKLSADQVIGRLRGKLSHLPGATLTFQAVQDMRVGGRATQAEYQYTLQGDDLAQLADWAPRVMEIMKTLPGLVDVSTDQQDRGLEADLAIDRDSATRLGLTAQSTDDTLYDAFGQRQVSTMYTELNQYHVVMEVDPLYSQNPEGLRLLYANAANGTPVPLGAFTKYVHSSTALAVNHQSQFPAVTLSFNLRPGVSLGTAVTEIERAGRNMGLPGSIHGKFAGTAQAYQDAISNQTLLICAALAAVYIVLGMLYESTIHPITIISTLPSAGVGALLALNLCQISLSVIALIGIILLIGIVKKNAILMIDFALDAERRQGVPPKEAIYQACILRFRPITMTTMAALLGGLPLALGTGVGSELRRPLGVAIVGGLIFSQALTLFTTPVVYLYLDRFRLWCRAKANAELVLGIVSAVLAVGPAILLKRGIAAPSVTLAVLQGVGLVIGVIGLILCIKNMRRVGSDSPGTYGKVVAGVGLSMIGVLLGAAILLFLVPLLVAG
jgi:multidrug efflux pump